MDLRIELQSIKKLSKDSPEFVPPISNNESASARSISINSPEFVPQQSALPSSSSRPIISSNSPEFVPHSGSSNNAKGGYDKYEKLYKKYKYKYLYLKNNKKLK